MTVTSFNIVADKRMRCPRCRARSTVQSVIEIRPGIQYLTLRCVSCHIVYDAQVQAPHATPSTLSIQWEETPAA